jgi:hypothetical protein
MRGLSSLLLTPPIIRRQTCPCHVKLTSAQDKPSAPVNNHLTKTPLDFPFARVTFEYSRLRTNFCCFFLISLSVLI